MTEVKRVADPRDGPADGVEADTECVVTHFGSEGEIGYQTLRPVNIKCARSHGTLSISIRDMGYMVSVRICDLEEILKEAWEAGHGNRG